MHKKQKCSSERSEELYYNIYPVILSEAKDDYPRYEDSPS